LGGAKGNLMLLIVTSIAVAVLMAFHATEPLKNFGDAVHGVIGVLIGALWVSATNLRRLNAWWPTLGRELLAIGTALCLPWLFFMPFMMVIPGTSSGAPLGIALLAWPLSWLGCLLIAVGLVRAHIGAAQQGAPADGAVPPD
jgi:hypothetical protein